jgi:murein DD-endopeptidase MepM/ murein hydrolase activator NlpD
VQWSRRKAVVAALGLALTLAGCGSGADTKGVASSNDQPVFVDSTPPGAPGTTAPATPPSPTAKPAPTATAGADGKPATYAFPVVGNNSYAHSHHDYPATDIITKCGNKVVAVTTGTILDVTKVDKWKASVNAGATRGGLSVSLLGDDGVRYYGSHLSVINAGITPGARVTTGQALGQTGDTGDASACHLHFGISPPCAKVGDWWTQRGTIFPWPYLDAWKKGQNKSAVAAVKDWQTAHGCPKKPLVDP